MQASTRNEHASTPYTLALDYHAATITWLPLATTGSSTHCFVRRRIVIRRLSTASNFDSKMNVLAVLVSWKGGL